MLQKSRGVFFVRSPKRRRQLRHRRTGLGDPEIVKKLQIHKIHTPKFQGVFFSEVAEAPQAAATQTHRAGGP